jgi:hypothetical protein
VALREAVATRLSGRRRGSLHILEPGLTAEVDAHGADGQPLRDPILRGWSADRSLSPGAHLPPCRP